MKLKEPINPFKMMRVDPYEQMEMHLKALSSFCHAGADCRECPLGQTTYLKEKGNPRYSCPVFAYPSSEKAKKKIRGWQMLPGKLPEMSIYGISREVIIIVRHIADPEKDPFPTDDSNFCGIYLARYYSTEIWATETTEFPTKDVVAWMDLPEAPWYIEEMLNSYGLSLRLSLKQEDETNETD